MAKSVAIAYILWFFFGWLGLHHFYLKRDRHAFFTFATLGGVFGLGWIRDLFYIPQYTADVNETPEFMEQLTEKMRARERPSIGLCRWAASLSLGYIFSILVITVLWTEGMNDRYLYVITTLAHIMGAVGVYIPMNEGRLKLDFKWCLLASLAALPFSLKYGSEYYYYGSLAATILAGWKIDWRRQPREAGFWRRFFALSLIATIYLGMISCAIYYNATITTKEGETVPLREAIHNFFKSPAWRETKESFKQIYEYYKHHGWKTLWQEIVDALDPQGEANAYKVLGVEASASQAEIKSAYKKLALKYHPDKANNSEQRQDYEQRFMEIQQAYDTLSKIKKGRSKKNQM